MHKIDCRGLNCPQPVLNVKKVVEQHSDATITIQIDAGAPLENVSRFLKNRGYSVVASVSNDGVILNATPPSAYPSESASTLATRPVLLITSDRLGDGPEELGRLLMKNFIISLLEQTKFPERILFLNTGIHLTTEGSEILVALDNLANQGVEIMSCGLCLDFFHKKDQLRAGSITNMFATAESLLGASSVIRL